jgi:hypothetical protein
VGVAFFQLFGSLAGVWMGFVLWVHDPPMRTHSVFSVLTLGLSEFCFTRWRWPTVASMVVCGVWILVILAAPLAGRSLWDVPAYLPFLFLVAHLATRRRRVKPEGVARKAEERPRR